MQQPAHRAFTLRSRGLVSDINKTIQEPVNLLQADHPWSEHQNISHEQNIDNPSNGHGNDATPDNETGHARFPLPIPLPQAGEGE